MNNALLNDDKSNFANGDSIKIVLDAMYIAIKNDKKLMDYLSNNQDKCHGDIGVA